MWDREVSLRELTRQIEPSAAQKAAASRSQNYLRVLLQSQQFGRRILDAYLSGSYARDTALAPIDDVDIVVVVDPAGWPRQFLSEAPEPDQILQSFARAIRHRYPEAAVYLQRRSVCLTLDHVDIDVVPAIELCGEGHRIRIPDTDSGEWDDLRPQAALGVGDRDQSDARGALQA